MMTGPCWRPRTSRADHIRRRREEAIARAVHALEEAIAARIHDRKDIPTPSWGETYAILPTLTSVKVMLYQGMRDQGVGKASWPALGVAPAAGGPRPGRSAPVSTGHDGRRAGSHRTAVARDRRRYRRPGGGGRWRRDARHELAAIEEARHTRKTLPKMDTIF